MLRSKLHRQKVLKLKLCLQDPPGACENFCEVLARIPSGIFRGGPGQDPVLTTALMPQN